MGKINGTKSMRQGQTSPRLACRRRDIVLVPKGISIISDSIIRMCKIRLPHLLNGVILESICFSLVVDLNFMFGNVNTRSYFVFSFITVESTA